MKLQAIIGKDHLFIDFLESEMKSSSFDTSKVTCFRTESKTLKDSLKFIKPYGSFLHIEGSIENPQKFYEFLSEKGYTLIDSKIEVEDTISQNPTTLAEDFLRTNSKLNYKINQGTSTGH